LRQLLPVITEGEPADNDVRNPQYLRFDAKRSVEDLGKNGILAYLSLDSRADECVSPILGIRNYVVIDNVARSPEKLPVGRYLSRYNAAVSYA